jgi:hypothetical protein
MANSKYYPVKLITIGIFFACAVVVVKLLFLSTLCLLQSPVAPQWYLTSSVDGRWWLGDGGVEGWKKAALETLSQRSSSVVHENSGFEFRLQSQAHCEPLDIYTKVSKVSEQLKLPSHPFSLHQTSVKFQIYHYKWSVITWTRIFLLLVFHAVHAIAPTHTYSSRESARWIIKRQRDLISVIFQRHLIILIR